MADYRGGNIIRYYLKVPVQGSGSSQNRDSLVLYFQVGCWNMIHKKCHITRHYDE
jgi:hypothetical protein